MGTIATTERKASKRGLERSFFKSNFNKKYPKPRAKTRGLNFELTKLFCGEFRHFSDRLQR